MKIFRSKKGELITLIVVISIIVMAFISVLYVMGGRECRTNKDCGNGYYCGSDFACHEIPVIEKSSGNSLTLPAIIIGFSMMITALILRWDKLRPGKKAEETKSSENKETQNKLKAP